jgi:hypothetical protein
MSPSAGVGNARPSRTSANHSLVAPHAAIETTTPVMTKPRYKNGPLKNRYALQSWTSW